MNNTDNYYSLKVRENEGDRLFQVGKTIMGKAVDDSHVDYIVSTIYNNLSLEKRDRVLDLCCGNGLITEKIKCNVDSIKGLELSGDLLSVARKHSDIDYVNLDLLSYNFKNGNENKAYMYEALQHFRPSQFLKLLSNIFLCSKIDLFFIGSIPDVNKYNCFYNTKDKKRYNYDFLLKDESHLGYWWERELIVYICNKLDLTCEVLNQNDKLYTSSYRFDVLISRKS